MTIHRNSKDALGTVDKSTRQRDIVDVCKVQRRPLTDRQILYYLKAGDDLNYVRPRITELIKDGTLMESGKIKCHITERAVRTVILEADNV